MAQSDVDNMRTGTRQAADPVTAEDQLDGFGESYVDTSARARAAAANVVHAAFINYDGALDNYAARPDVEDLQHKNARNIPDDFADADFMRATNEDQWGTSGPDADGDANNDGTPGA